ncbi:MAG: hypothetical protein COA82_04770 [Alkaliphilus sp.]|nr:YwmB family TATA-box binding protein [bacterium AH-315-L21]MBN4062574.1 YwmB family TATA-box binding protein [Alkaliphilus sp. AH-315-G20]MBN4074559.1 YwmB family TATA-box binding protein [bacterium AH-315-E09]PHS35372.1 MAG: hypothetical protein COA82_04770 [Alkaliphilus sp.]
MKNKKMIIVIVTLVVSLGILYASAGEYFNDQEIECETKRHALINAFEISNADFFEANIHTSLYLKDVFFEISEMEIKKDELISKLQLEGEIKTIEGRENFDSFMMQETFSDTREGIYSNRISEDGYNQITVVSFDKSGKITVIILYSSKYEDEKESFVIIDRTQNMRYEDIEIDKKTNEELLIKYGDEIETTICLVGTYHGRLTEIEKQKIFESLIKELDATVIDNVLNQMYTSATLYTPYIYEKVEFDETNINLQVAMRYNGFENKTYIWIATPFITYTY